MATPANWGKLVSFTASERKPDLIPFGYFSPNDNLGFIADSVANGAPLVITGVQNGVNTHFTVMGMQSLYFNGLRLKANFDYTYVGINLTMVIAPQADDTLLAFGVA